MHYRDLTPYQYGGAEPQPNVLNVGWLSAEHAFPTGASAPNQQLIEALRRLVRNPMNLYRGSHICELCPEPPRKLSPGGITLLDPPRETMGNGEIRIVARDGTTYVAPVLVLHYVSTHRYSPPLEFIEAAMAAAKR